MRKKLNCTKLLLAFALLISIYSCTREDLLQQENPKEKASASSARYASGSFWKEDDVYIRKVQQVFMKNANLERFNTTYGELYWNYAMSFGQFGEKYLLVPIVKKDKVVLLMQAVRKGDRLFFYEKTDPDMISFFQTAIYEKVTGFNETLSDGNLSKGLIYVCSTRTLEVGCDGEPGCVPYVKTVTDCGFQQGGTPPKGLDPWGDPNFGGGGGNGDDGYEYPDPPEEVKDPCTKLKEQNSNQAFKDKVSELDKQKVFDEYEETGFVAAYGATPFEPLANAANDNLLFPPGDKYFGYIHVHLDSKGGVKIFSPADIMTFLTKCVRNAQENGSIADAYGMVITSQGNYILKYSGDGNYGIGPVTLKNWNEWYNIEFAKIANEDGTLSQDKVEKLFTRFLKEKIKMSGLDIYKSDKTTGNTNKLEYDGIDKPVKSTQCPN